MNKKKVLAKICYVLCVVIITTMVIILVEVVIKRNSGITDVVNVSRNIYKSSMQEAEQYLRKENIDYTKDGDKLKVGDVFFIMVENTLTIDSEKSDISSYIEIILNTDLSGIRQSVKNNTTTYYLEDLKIIEKNGDFKYYIKSVETQIKIGRIFLYILIFILGFRLFLIDPFDLFKAKI